MMACSLVLHRMNTLTTNCKLVATCASTYTPHTTSLDLHIETHIQVLLCDQCSDEAMPVCTTCVAYGVVAYLYKHMFNCRHIGPSCQAQLRDTPMSRPWYIDFFHSRIRRGTLGVARQLVLPEPQRPSGLGPSSARWASLARTGRCTSGGEASRKHMSGLLSRGQAWTSQMSESPWKLRRAEPRRRTSRHQLLGFTRRSMWHPPRAWWSRSADGPPQGERTGEHQHMLFCTTSSPSRSLTRLWTTWGTWSCLLDELTTAAEGHRSIQTSHASIVPMS